MRYRILSTWQGGYFVYCVVDNDTDSVVASFSDKVYANGRVVAAALCKQLNSKVDK